MIKLLTYATTFIIIVLCELGDKTQVATLIFATNNPRRRWQVFSAAACALVACVAIEVTVGLALSRVISPAMINRAAGVVFLLIGLYLGALMVAESRRARVLRRAATDQAGPQRQ